MIRLGPANTALVFGTRIENMTLDLQAKTGSKGVISDCVNEQGGVRNCLIRNYMDRGIDFTDTVDFSANHYIIEDSEIGCSSSAGTSPRGIFLSGRHGGRGVIRRVTVNPKREPGSGADTTNEDEFSAGDTINLEAAVAGQDRHHRSLGVRHGGEPREASHIGRGKLQRLLIPYGQQHAPVALHHARHRRGNHHHRGAPAGRGRRHHRDVLRRHPGPRAASQRLDAVRVPRSVGDVRQPVRPGIGRTRTDPWRHLMDPILELLSGTGLRVCPG